LVGRLWLAPGVTGSSPNRRLHFSAKHFPCGQWFRHPRHKPLDLSREERIALCQAHSLCLSCICSSANSRPSHFSIGGSSIVQTIP
jgi:hypothetical protein